MMLALQSLIQRSCQYHLLSQAVGSSRLTCLPHITDRDDIPSITVERFLPLMLEQEEEGQTLTPCFTHGGINYIYIRYNNLYRAWRFSTVLHGLQMNGS